MDRKPWRRLISRGKPARFDSATGVLDLHECALATSSPSTLCCSVAGGPSLALGKLTESTVRGRVCARLSEDVTFTCSGGDVVVTGMLVGPPGASETPSLQAEAAAVAPKSKRLEPAAAASNKHQAEPAAGVAPKKHQAEPAAAVAPKKQRPEPAEPASKKQRLEPPPHVAKRVSRTAASSAAPAAAKEPAAPVRPKEIQEPGVRQLLPAARPEAAAAHAVASEKAQAAAELLRAAAPRRVAEEPAAKAAASGTTLAEELKDAEPLSQRSLKSGLRYEVLEVGQGAIALPARAVRINFEGRLASTGVAFDSGTLDFRVGLNEVVRGLDEGVGGMVMGERRRLHVPARCGYGSEGSKGIPANSNLVFDVELVRC